MHRPWPRSVVITGATGYLGRPVATLAAARGHVVKAIVRRGAEARAPAGMAVMSLDPFSVDALAAALSPGDTLVHLVGTPRPNPRKAQQFVDVDLASVRAAAEAAGRAGVAHIVYVSVAHPAPIMHDYIAVRLECEALIAATGIPATILRPWYVIGPGHWWPCALLPVYWVFARVPATRATARRLGLVTHAQMIGALMQAIERGPEGAGILDVPAIRVSTPNATA